MKIVTIVGNPKAKSKTYQFAQAATEQLKALLAYDNQNVTEEVMFDLADYGTDLVQWNHQTITSIVEHIDSAQYIIIASPTYKASYTGLLKLFLDVLPMNALQHKLVFPIMVGAAPHHQLACEVHLKPVLAELGATTAHKGLYLLDSQLEQCEELLKQWIESNATAVKSIY